MAPNINPSVLGLVIKDEIRIYMANMQLTIYNNIFVIITFVSLLLAVAAPSILFTILAKPSAYTAPPSGEEGEKPGLVK